MCAMSRPVKQSTGKHKMKRVAKFVTALKVGDMVMVMGGGNSRKNKTARGRVGKILRFLPKRGRVIVEGVNMIKRHKRKASPTDSGGIIEKEGSIHVSKVMYYSEDLKRPVRICYRSLEGQKVRGFYNKEKGQFVQIEARG